MKRALLVLCMAVMCVACGVPESSEFRPIPKQDLPFDLGKSATTTTAPPNTQPQDGTEVNLYFVTAASLVRESRVLSVEPTPRNVILLLITEPMSITTFGVVRSALPNDLDFEIEVEKGVASVNTSTSLLTDVPPFDQTLAVAQIVLTLTSLPGIGQVRFTVNDRPQSVPRGAGDLTAPGAEVTFDDYKALLIN